MSHHRPGDRVFAKIKGFSNWPARINPLPPDVIVPKGKLPVFFYGTYQVSFVPAKNIVPYDEFKSKWGKPKANPQFMAAMQEIESNPGILMLGEDPRAEQFLLQFYSFRPSNTSAQDPEECQKSPSLHSTRSASSVSSSPTHRTHSNHSSKMGHHSETSSERSSAFSKQTIGSDNEDDNDVERTMVSHTHCTDTTEPNGEDKLDSESYEAHKLARRLQKKAEKKAAKKAAKKEAKRLAKEAERAERRALREAKRERKRLHRLEKQRLLEQQHQRSPILSDQDGTTDQMELTNDAPVLLSPLADMPYDELIGVELEGSDLSPRNNDRPTSPLCFGDFTPMDLYPEVSYSADKSVPEATLLSASPLREVLSPESRGSTKRSPTSPSFSPDDKVKSSQTDEAQQSPTPPPTKKRSKTESTQAASHQVSPTPDFDELPSINSKRAVISTKTTKRGKTRKRRLIAEDRENVDLDLISDSQDTGSRSSQRISDNKPLARSIEAPEDSTTAAEGVKVEDTKESNDPSAKRKRMPSNTNERSTKSPGSPDVITQLRHLCRDLKASLIRGHENFSAAVAHLNHLTEIPFRLPQLAHVWDLMDCIKKCRRYKLSAEVREAAQNTLRSLQVVQSGATKEELAEFQALIASHQTRTTPPSTDNAKKSPKQAVLDSVDLTQPVTSSTVTPTVSATNTPSSNSVTISTANRSPASDPPVDIHNEDLAAKVDDMLSLIRATEERMAAASYQRSSHTVNKPTVSNSSEVNRVTDAGGHSSTIRASALAAAAAHMHDEEDEESVVSRIEQVAVYEEASKSFTTIPNVSSPPPPPPLPMSTSSYSVHHPLTSTTDLDLDSRIEMIITGPGLLDSRSRESPKTNAISPVDQNLNRLPSALLARRQAIADKLAAKKASAREHAERTAASNPSLPKDDEIYDLLGV